MLLHHQLFFGNILHPVKDKEYIWLVTGWFFFQKKVNFVNIMWHKFWDLSSDIANLLEYFAKKRQKNSKKVNFFKIETKNQKNRNGVTLEKVSRSCKKNLVLLWQKLQTMFYFQIDLFKFIGWRFSATLVSRGEDWSVFLRMNRFFTNIFWLSCGVVTIFLLLPTTKSGVPHMIRKILFREPPAPLSGKQEDLNIIFF